MTAPVLVIGATGRVAGALVDGLVADGHPVRALVRDRARALARFPAADHGGAIEVLEGAFDDVRLLDQAFDGVAGAYLGLGTSPMQEQLEMGLIDAAARHQVPHLVRLSVFAPDPASDFEVARRHGVLDRHLQHSGVPFTALRPTYFSSNLLLAAPSIASSGTWSTAVPDGRIAIIDARDVGLAARTVLTSPEHRASTYDLTGPVALTFAEVAGLFSDVLGRPVEHRPISVDERREGLTSRGVPDWLADIAVGIDVAVQSGAHDATTPDLERLLGGPPRTVADFIVDHRTAFV